MLQKMVHVFKTPLVARTAQQKMRVRRMEQSLDRMKLEARVPTHDLDCIVQHVIRVNEAMQECIWAGGLARGSNKKLLHEKMLKSFKNPWLRGLMTNSWQPYENSYCMSVRHFFYDLAIHGVQKLETFMRECLSDMAGRCFGSLKGKSFSRCHLT